MKVKSFEMNVGVFFCRGPEFFELVERDTKFRPGSVNGRKETYSGTDVRFGLVGEFS